MTVGLDQLEGLQFTPHVPYTFCRICGDVFQTAYDRDPTSKFSNWLPDLEAVARFATLLRKEWSLKHSKEHKMHEHLSLAMSGRFLTPEASIKLASFGAFSIIDMAIDNEVESALKESSPIPDDDAQDK